MPGRIIIQAAVLAISLWLIQAYVKIEPLRLVLTIALVVYAIVWLMGLAGMRVF